MSAENLPPDRDEPVAGNGLLSRRVFLQGALASGALGAGLRSALAEPLAVQPWMKTPGAGFSGYGQPSRFETGRTVDSAAGESGDTPVSAPHARRCICWKGSSRRQGCTSSAAIPGYPTSIPISIGSSSMGA